MTNPLLRGIAIAILFTTADASHLIAAEVSSASQISRVTVNGRTDPLGIAADDISFGWSESSPVRGTVQRVYQIRVGSKAGAGDVWDSGRVESSRQVDVSLPANVILAAATRYHWQVKVWDGENRASGWSEAAWFETGLLNSSDWADAKWITRPTKAPDPAEWTDYTATIQFTLQNEAFGVFLRSSADAKDSYMMQVNVAGKDPVFKVHRRAASNYQELAAVDLSKFHLTNAGLKGTKSTLRFDVSGSTIITQLNGTVIDTRSGVDLPHGLVGVRTFGNEAGLVHRIQVVEPGGRKLIERSFDGGGNGFSGGTVINGALSLSGTTDAVFTDLPPSLPLLRGRIKLRDGIASARAYATARGIYQISANGKKAGDQFLAPGWTDYNQRIQSQTYDITALVKPGDNVIGVALADGWYHGKVGIGWSRVYGDRLAFLGKIKVTYRDGSSEWFSTGADWKAGDGPFVRGDLQDGERFDANLEQAGWNTPAFNDSTWPVAEVLTPPTARVVPQPDEPVRAKTELTAKSRTEISPHTWIYDLGQNMVGVPKVTLKGKKGETAILRHAEDLYHTGPHKGGIYTDNLRSAQATDSYTFAADGTVTYQPTFTQHGFRYIEVTGLAQAPAAADVKGVVLGSDLRDTGDLATSHPMLNKLVSNIRWGQKSNFLSIPTDTPARDERLGWTGDINVFAPAAARFQDTRAFLSKWMNDVRDAQKPNGNLPAVVPQPRNEFNDTGVGWSDACITVPYAVWRATGDERIVRANWEAMKKFHAFVKDGATRDGNLTEDGRSSFFSGDWLTLESVKRLEEHKVIGTVYFAEDTRMMSEMAAVMGETEKAAEWAALVTAIREAFVKAYRSGDGAIYTGTQTAYAMALGADMIADPAMRAQTAERFVQKLASDNNHLRTGFLGTPWLLPALSKIGREDLAMQLLLNETYPSWGFPISMGATTMWERWNSIRADGEFGPVDMNSFNHYAYGAVGDWMFGKLGGIQALEPGYKKVRIAPLIGQGGLSLSNCSQETPYGRLASEWKVAGSQFFLKVEIPVNTTAIVSLPQSAGTAITENGTPAASAAGVKRIDEKDGATNYEVGSGTYVFGWRARSN
ncbi:MAG: family 78 glycoside hydrolase catalytic domain [Luteolibacter sp.]